MDHQRFVDERTVAARIGLSVSTLRRDRFAKQGLPYIKVGRRCLYDLLDVDAFMEARKIQPEAR